ncbi:glycosyltransferase family A protein [Lactovum odontotermitis]
MKKLSIVIPFKGQTESDLARVLGSINGQIGIDFNQLDVHLVNDGGPAINYSKFKILSNLTLYYHQLPENVGPGLARQYGIDHSEGEYLMFIDSDDELHYAGALLDFFNVLKGSGDHQVIIGRFLEQKMGEDGVFRYFSSNVYNWGALHGKFFNRSYLQSLDLRFHPALRAANEDLYFVGLACMLATDIYQLDSVIYSWLWNGDSLGRSNNNALIHKTHLYVDYCYFTAEKIKEKKPELLASSLEGSILHCYEYYRDYPPLTPKEEQLFYDKMEKFLDDFSGNWPGLENTKNVRLQTPGFRSFIEKVNAHSHK